MKSNHAKVAHKILGKPMIEWVADAAIAAGCQRIIVVVGSHAQEVRDIIDASYASAAASRAASAPARRRAPAREPVFFRAFFAMHTSASYLRRL